MEKHIFKILIAFTVLIAVALYLLSYKMEVRATVVSIDNGIYTNENAVVINEDIITISSVLDIDGSYPLNKMYAIQNDGSYLYSLSYPSKTLEVGDTLTKKALVSDQLYLIFSNTYPNVSLKSMGVNTILEAYQVRQLAIYEIGYRTGEANYFSELSKIDSIREEIGAKNLNQNVYQKAKELVSYIETYPEISAPTLLIDNSKVKFFSGSDGYLLGPYSLNITTGIISDGTINVVKDGMEIDVKIVDKNQKVIDDITEYMDDEIYIMLDSNALGTYEIHFSIDVLRLSPVIYEKDGYDYIADTYISINLSRTLEVNLTLKEEK